MGLILSGSASERSETIARAPAAAAAANRAARQPAAARVGKPPTSRAWPTNGQRVTNISSVQVMRRSASPFANDPFFQYFFGDPDDLFGRSRRAAEPGLGRRHFRGRPGGHQPARNRRERGRGHRHHWRSPRGAREDHRRRFVDRPGAPEESTTRICRSFRGAIRRS